MDVNLSLVKGPEEPRLWEKTLGTLVDEQAASLGDKPALVVPWKSVRMSFRQLAERSRFVAHAMLSHGLVHGDRVGVMAGNRHQYIEVFLAGGRIGCPVVVLNNTYTPSELGNAVRLSGCKVMFMASKIGSRSLAPHMDELRGTGSPNPKLPELRRLVCFDEEDRQPRRNGIDMQSYSQYLCRRTKALDKQALQKAEQKVKPTDVVNLQFTSGTTGDPKAAMLTHNNLLNNGRYIGRALRLDPSDVVCCPPPLFHCFGLVLGFLASLSHGSTIVFPSDHFDAKRVVDTLYSEHVTVLLGVPTMFVAELEVLGSQERRPPPTLRAGLASGAAVPAALTQKLRDHMGLEKILIAYGMTETSPITFITSLDDSEGKRKTIGRAMPHIAAKIIDGHGNVVARGQMGELCVSGYALQKGYWKNEKQTGEVMKRDKNGVLWMHTGDEVIIDAEGYAHITGRIKDVIIRGGENIFPLEIEERLMAHPCISDASVVGLKDCKYGEVVSAFLQEEHGHQRPSDNDIRAFVTEVLGQHKAPQHMFWIGDEVVGEDFPKTGSGKHQKHILRAIGNRLIGARKQSRSRI